MPISSEPTGIDQRAVLLPLEILPLFDDAFIRSCDLHEEYVFRLAQGVFLRSGLAAACASPATIDAAIERAGLDPRAAQVPVDWLFRLLARRGMLCIEDEYGMRRYRVAGECTEFDPEPVRFEQERHDHRALPAYAIAALAAEHYPAVMRGEITGECALFGMKQMAAWASYFANDNVLYSISNTLGAMACVAELQRQGGAVLEVGGGLGSGAAALCERLAGDGRAGAVSVYRFTELSMPFLRCAQKTLSGVYPDIPFAFARLDMNRPFAEAGVEPGGYALVHAVNALHVAHDLAFTLGQIREALCPGGALVIAECVRPFLGQPVYTEFVFNLLEAFQQPLLVPEWRPNGGFLTPEQWTAALHENGFRDVRWLPDIPLIRDAYPAFVVAAIVARRA